MVTAGDASKEIVEGHRCVGPPYRSSEFILAHLPGVTPGDHCMDGNTCIGQASEILPMFAWSETGSLAEIGELADPPSIWLLYTDLLEVLRTVDNSTKQRARGDATRVHCPTPSSRLAWLVWRWLI